MLGFVAFAFAIRKAGGINLLWVGAGLGAVLWALVVRARRDAGLARWPAVCGWIAGLTWLGGVVDPRLAPTPANPDPDLIAHLLSLIWLVVAVALLMLQRRGLARGPAVGLAIVLVAIVAGVVGIAATPSPEIDVRNLHLQAAEALAQGQSPYDAVRVEDTSPLVPPGTMIRGYLYPPVTAIAYTAGVWLADDPRLTSLLAFALVLVCAALMAGRLPRELRPAGSWLVLALALQPGWPYMLEFSWTEPLSLMLVAVALLHWERRPLASAIALGLAFASKQYFALGALLLVRPSDRRSNRRLVVAGLTGVATMVPFALWDPEGLWRANVGFHANVPTRFDASNIAGLLASFDIHWHPPIVLVAGVPLLLAVWLRRYAGTAAGFASSLAAVLAAAFLLGTHAFANYWFLIGNLLLLSVIAGRTAGDESR